MERERTYQYPNNVSIDLSIQKRMHTLSMRLLDLISAEFAINPFSLDDVTSTFNARPKDVSSQFVRLNKFGESHLSYLTSIGALDYDSETQNYLVNPNSPYMRNMVN
ncbi:hypothetical protein J4477_04840 [Candidatus Pacearchaeota archaeon]|nr:hypothetical protein [Candidatus Pacearchaeota archaeon]